MNRQTALVDQIVQALNTRQWPDYVLGEFGSRVGDIDDPRLLLYVNGWAVDRHAFGEGEFHLVLSKKDLMTANLDRAEVFYEPGT